MFTLKQVIPDESNFGVPVLEVSILSHSETEIGEGGQIISAFCNGSGLFTVITCVQESLLPEASIATNFRVMVPIPQIF